MRDAGKNTIAHALKLIRRRRAILTSHDRRPDRTVSDQKRDVRTDASSLQPRTLGREIDAAAAVRIPDDRRDALCQQRQALPKLPRRQPFESVRMNVDEAGRHETIGRIDEHGGSCTGKPSDSGNAIAAYVGFEPRIARAVHDATVANQNIERCRRLSRRQSRCESKCRKTSR